MKPVLILISLMALYVVSCSSISVDSDYDENFDFSKLKSYRWLEIERSAPNDPLSNPIVRNRVRSAVDKELLNKGFVITDTDSPDFYVTVHGGLQDKVNVTNYGYSYGGWYGAYPHQNVSVNYYTEATLFIDVISATGKKELVWRGAGTGTLSGSRDPEDAKEKINQAAYEILYDFPPTK